MIFHKGNEVIYKEFVGTVAFVCERSMSILIRQGQHPSQDVRLIVYSDQFNQIRLFKESSK